MRLPLRWAAALLAVVVAAAAAQGVVQARHISDRIAGLGHSLEVTDEAGRMLRAFSVEGGIWRLAADPQTVSPRYLSFLVAYEDKRFAAHHGVDLLALARAAWQWARSGRVVSGASTITMQTVRLLDGSPGHGIGYKLLQAERALLLEQALGKQDILRLYLLLAPFGGNLEGVRAASLAYFGKEPVQLTAGEAALLVALPQSPAHRPDRESAQARHARDRVLRRMVAARLLTADAARAAGREAMPDLRQTLPMHAPHLTQRLAAEAPSSGPIATTIDGRLQRVLEPIIRNDRGRLDPHANLALIVVRNADAAVVAHFGSSDILDPERSGDIDFSRAIRSPGSALKPFVYGMAFERLLVHPDTIMLDAPAHYGSYAPTNFDGDYTGLVTVREALRQSLNTTAVALLDALGPPSLAARFRAVDAPLRLPGPDADASPALAVGGCGISLERLVTLYTGLANHGIIRPLRVRPGDPVEPGRVLLKADAAWAVADILASGRRPGGAGAGQVDQPRPIAFKTGTSAGYRDAWAVGFNADYTVGVWIGRADAAAMPGQYGRVAALPLVFRAFDQLAESFGEPGGPAPTGSPLLPRTDLPPRLARFEPRAVFSETPVIDTPVSGSQTIASASGVVLRGHGGQPPWRWLADGQPIAPPSPRIETTWLPRHGGQVSLELIDGAGESSGASIWLDLKDPDRRSGDREH